MQRLSFLAIPLILFCTPALSADLDGPVYRERETFIERPAPRIVERERVIVEHHHHYVPAPVYTERRIYAEPRVYYRPRVYAHYHKPFHAHAGWRARHDYPRGHRWHRHKHRGW